MPNRKPSLFLTPLTLGGKFTLVNANFWVIFVLLARSDSLSLPVPIVIAYIFECLLPVMGFPLLWLVPTISGETGIWAILQPFGLPGVWGMLAAVILLGINAFIWGYGLAWIIEIGRRLFLPKP